MFLLVLDEKKLFDETVSPSPKIFVSQFVIFKKKITFLEPPGLK